jgi:ribonuclease-3
MTDQDLREQCLHRFTQEYHLTDLAPRDLDLAFTHRSYAYEKETGEDNERLEFLGDAVISAITSEYLYLHDPAASEGVLSKIRSRLVSRNLLGRRAVELGLGELLLLGRGERDTGGAERSSTLGSALEALVGMIYLRLGYDAARQFVCHHVIEALIAIDASERAHSDYKSLLQEWAQQHYRKVPTYTRLGAEGPDHDKKFFVQVELADTCWPKPAACGSRSRRTKRRVWRWSGSSVASS